MWQDFIEYLKDIVLFRQERFAFKTAAFVKRHRHSIGHKLYHVWDELKKVGRGFVALKEDAKYYFKYHKGRIDYKYDRASFKQISKLSQVK
jgi:hypothetical protein